MFASDNCGGVHPRIVDAMVRCAGGTDAAYGEDALTRRVERRLADIFERECAVFLVATGTAANALGLGALAPPYGAIYCHPEAHINTDESGAPEMYTGGAKLVAVDGPDGKIDPEALQRTLDEAVVHGIHRVKPSVVCVTNQTERGAIYRPADLVAISLIAKARGLRLFHDGARFANAVAALGLSPADLTWKAGIDAMSFGKAPSGAVQIVLDEATLALPLAGIIDVAAESKRLKREIDKVGSEIRQLDAKLANEKFVARAPEHVVEEQRERKADAEATAARLEQALKRLEAAL